MNLIEAKHFIAMQNWRVARSMPKIPHAYIVKGRLIPEGLASDKNFEQFANLIVDSGRDMKWHNVIREYLDIGEYRYWIMGPADTTDILNRELITDSLCREMWW